MLSFNVINVINVLTQSIINKYDIEWSDVNESEINFANHLLEIIENYVKSINDYEDGELVSDEDSCESDDMSDCYANEENDPDYTDHSPNKVSTWLILPIVI